MMREAERMTSTLVTAEELAENQSQIIGMLPLQLESNEGVAGALASMESFGLGLDYLQRMPGMIAALTRPQLRDTARRYLQPQARVLAVAGPE
jgi:zinc protease